MQNTFKRLALLVIALLSCLCVTLGLSACGDKEPETATYSVTVTTTATDLTLTTIKAQWLNADDSAASDEIALNSDGKASVELNKGDYTVTLKGVPAGYTFEKKSVSADNPDATIAIAKSQDDSTTTTFSIKVTMPAGESLPADAKVQLFKGETPVGTAAALNANGQATLTADNGEYSVILTGLPAYLTYPATTVKTDDKESAEIVVDYATLTYTINVDEGNYTGALTGVKVQLWSTAATPEKIAEGEIVDGVATIQAKAADYTVKLDGLATDYGFTAVTLSKTVTEADIDVTGHQIAVTVVKNENASSVNFADLTATIKSGSTVIDTVTPNANGVATFAVPDAAYTVELTFPATVTGFKANPVSIAQGATTASIEIVATPEKGSDYGEPFYELMGVGKYEDLSVEYEDYGYMQFYEVVAFNFTALTDGKFTFTWDSDKISYTESCDQTEIPSAQTATSREYPLKAGRTLTFKLSAEDSIHQSADDDTLAFNLEVTKAPLGDPGTIYNPYEFDYTYEPLSGGLIASFDYKVYDEIPAEMTEVYFEILTLSDGIQLSENQVIEIVPAAGVSIYLYGNNPLWDGKSTSAQLTQDVYKNICLGDDEYIYLKCLVFRSNSGNISFEIKKYVNMEEGGDGNPLTLTAGEVTTAQFDGKDRKLWANMWYTFEPAATQEYILEFTQSNTDIYVHDGAIEGPVIHTFTYETSTQIVTLEQSKTYYLQVYNGGYGNVAFKLTAFDRDSQPEGSIYKPATAAAGSNTVGTINSSTENITKYYTFTADNDGLLIITLGTFSQMDVSVTLSIYSSDSYADEAKIGYSVSDPGANWMVDGAPYMIKSGDILYIKAEASRFNPSANVDISFTISNKDLSSDFTTISGATEVTGVTQNIANAFYTITADKAGTMYVTFGGFTYSYGALKLDMYAFEEDDGEIFPLNVLNMGSTGVDPTSKDNGTLSFTVTEGQKVYFMLTYSGSVSSFKFAAEVLTASDLEKEATAGNNTLANVETWHHVTYTYNNTERGTLKITTTSAQDIAIKIGYWTTPPYGNPVFNSYIDVEQQISSNQSFEVYWIGSDVSFDVSFVAYKTATVGDNTLDTAEEAKTAVFTFKPTATGYYTFTLSDATATVLTQIDGTPLPKIFTANTEVLVKVTYTSTGASPKLVIAKLEPINATNAAEGIDLQSQVTLFKFKAETEGIYTATVDGAATVKFYDVTSYEEVTLFHLAAQGEILVAVELDGAPSSQKLTIAKVDTPTDIQAEDGTDISDVTTYNKVGVYKFTATEANKYEFSVTGENVEATIALFDDEYNALNGNKASLEINGYVYVLVTYKQSGETASNVKIVAAVSQAIQAKIGEHESYGYCDPIWTEITAATTTDNTITIEASYDSGSTIEYLVIDFSTNNSEPDYFGGNLEYSVTITGNNGEEYEYDGTWQYYACQDSTSTSVTIELTYRLSEEMQCDQLYIGLSKGLMW